MRSNHFRRDAFPLFLTLIFSSLSVNALPAADQLRSQAGEGKFDLALPVPRRLQNSPLLTPARADWLQAERLYSDGAFKPKAQQRIDNGANPMIMLQGFHWYADNYWYHPANGWWGELESKAAEIGRDGFGLIWFPPVSRGSYYPTEWYNLDSQWGVKDRLIRAVNAMHSNGVLVLADVVLNHRNGSKDWADFTNPDWPSSVIVRNDEWQGSPKSQNDDEGQGDFGCRDLDHRDPIVQKDSKVFMRWLKNSIGFDGWRYDMVKGYAPYHVGDYNNASAPVFTVGEVYDGNRQVVTNWVDGTDNSPGKANASSAFDFPTKFNLISAIENERYEMLNDNGRPSGLIGWWPAKAVTFVENHDTSPRDPNFIKNASPEYKAQRLMGYAYILTHPGVPCVFWPHFFDWGQDYQNRILALMNVRRAAGITSTSRMGILAATNELYAAVIDGDKGRVVVKIGRNWGWNPGSGWTLAASGDRYAVWTQPLPK
ncbi:MAG: alpha-amylase family glycosyl hydrolase [Elusimicrobia bacterium]|nr:alpha-amylase family glycosyl hydrolase [Elusimicrobiota bacterium]